MTLPGLSNERGAELKPKKPGRSLRVADQIARDLAVLIPQEVRDPRVGLVTITGCE
ncbi:ribosome-binding factor A, partial [gut metagenome]